MSVLCTNKEFWCLCVWDWKRKVHSVFGHLTDFWIRIRRKTKIFVLFAWMTFGVRDWYQNFLDYDKFKLIWQEKRKYNHFLTSLSESLENGTRKNKTNPWKINSLAAGTKKNIFKEKREAFFFMRAKRTIGRGVLWGSSWQFQPFPSHE